VHHAIQHALHSRVGPVIVVTGAVDLALDELDRDDTGLQQPATLTVVTNPHWSHGQATSLVRAATAVDDLQPHADAMVVALGDQPFVTAETWRAIADAPPEHQIVVASYDGRRGPHPVRLHRSLWAALPQTGDDGARTLIREHSALVHEVSCAGSAADIDTLEDLQRWTSS
jgi:CTP:molybdopterin cytidylyltransferase MocA